MEPEGLAEKRADLIIQVRSGKRTAVDAARELGVSRKTYYKWEARTLEALIESLSDHGEGGRPAKEPDPEKEALRGRVAELEERLRDQEQAERVRAQLGHIKKE